MPSVPRKPVRPGIRLVAGALAVALVLGAAAVAAGVVARVGPFDGGAGAVALPPPRFVEEARAAGLDHAYGGEFDFFVGGGVAVFDCDGDGRQDAYVAGGSEPAALFRNVSPLGGELRFTRLADAATDLRSVVGAYPLDVDGDRNTDLVVLRLGENILLRGLGDCRFARANEAWRIDGGNAWTTAFSATWEGDVPLPTLAFGNYLERTATGEAGDTCATSELVRSDQDGRAYAPAIPLTPGRCALSMLFSAWDRSVRRDLRVSNDRHYDRDAEEQLWRIVPGEAPGLYGPADGWQPLRIWGMGIASQDLTGDGYPEVFLTSQGDNKLQTLADGPSRPRFRDIALTRNATAHRPFAGDVNLPSTAWHPAFEDVNNDGIMDLFITKGNVEAMPDYAARDPSDLLIGQADGTFEEGAEAAGIVSFARARGAALADFNLDGTLDVLVVNRRENVRLWRNVGPAGHWVALRLDQSGANHDAIGSWVEVRAGDRTTVREVTVGGGHASGQLGWIHFGLGTADRAAIRVTWPDGRTGPWQDVTADEFVVVQRDASEPQPWSPPGG